MKKQLLAGMTVLALAAGMTTGAKAFEQKPGKGGHHAGHVHASVIGGMRHYGTHHRLARANGYRGPRQVGLEGGSSFGHGGFIDLGPLGMTACGSYRHRPDYCDQRYSIEAWSR